MKRRGFRKSRATWAWANSVYVQSSNVAGLGAGSTLYQATAFLPPNRVSYLCDTRNRKSVTHVKTLVWLKTWWNAAKHESGGGTSLALPSVNLYIIRSQADAVGSENEYSYNPYTVPALPGAMTGWDDDVEEASGIDPFLWTCPILGGPNVGNIIQTAQDAAGDGSGVNAGNFQVEGGTQEGASTFQGSAMNVVNPFMPTFEVRARRRLMRDQWLVFGAEIIGNPDTAGFGEANTLQFNVLMSWRMLLS